MSATIDELRSEIRSLKVMLQQISDVVVRQAEETAPLGPPAPRQVDRIRSAIATAGRPLTAAEIADLTGTTPAAVRAVIYDRPQSFRRVRLSPRRARWALADDLAAESRGVIGAA